MQPVLSTSLSQYPLLRRGKVRDLFDVGNYLLMVASDRISAFDVIMGEPIPDKGRILTQISLYWFDRLRDIIPHHVVSTNVASIPGLTDEEQSMLEGRSMIVRKTTPLTVECVVRGYLAGSGWKEYQASGTVCGIPLPDGLVVSSQLPEPLFTPSTKADEGHDENITFAQCEEILGTDLAARVRTISLALYTRAREIAAGKGLILADTKFEFGIDAEGSLILIDEALTPDSSRYWLAESYQPGIAQENFDKQVLRDWLETTSWDKQPPPPTLPIDVIHATQQKYSEALHRIVGTP